MPLLKLLSLYCQDQEDDTGPDEPYLLVDGKKIDCSPMSEGGSKSLSHIEVFKFEGNISVRLRDEDWPDADDDLGTVVIKSSGLDDPEKELEAEFRKDDAHYLLRYRVLP
jgi:hypothetical protein